MNDVDVLVVGAGALGLACAARLAEAGHGVLVAERERLVGSHTSSRNSEVIHAGLYYPPGSLKADLCLEGRERLYSWCARHGVGHRRIGKLLVAVEENEREKLQALAANARACGVDDLMPLDGAKLRALEPQVRGVAALLSPSTGIIDSHAYLQSLQAVAERHGAQLALDTRVDRLERHADGWRAEGQSVGEAFRLRAGWVINAGGLPRRWRNAPKASIRAWCRRCTCARGAISPTAAARRSATWSTRCPRRAPPGSASTPPSTSAASCASVPT